METTTQDSKRKALGRGLEVLLPSARPTPPAPSPTTDESGSREIAIDLIERNPYQTRRKFSQSAIDELAASITSSGVIQPIVVRPVTGGSYQLISGERRLLASKQAGKTTIPAVIRQVSNQQALEMTIIENLQREDLNAMDQARAYERLAREFNLTQEQMAIKTGKDRASVANFLRLLKLPSEVQAMVESDELSLGHAKALLMLGDEPIILRTATKVVADALSVRKTEALVQSLLYPNSGNEEKANTQSREPADPNVREAQFHLQRALGTKVTIHDKQGKGKIVIEYASLEDFDRVVEALGN
ncbi:MAG TPA: ParB/RepB/Spo0J family partition protein [Terriglobales bacterium]